MAKSQPQSLQRALDMERFFPDPLRARGQWRADQQSGQQAEQRRMRERMPPRARSRRRLTGSHTPSHDECHRRSTPAAYPCHCQVIRSMSNTHQSHTQPLNRVDNVCVGGVFK